MFAIEFRGKLCEFGGFCELGASMKTAIKYVAVALVALSVSGGFDAGAEAALTKDQQTQLRGEIRDAIKEQIVALQERVDHINEDLADDPRRSVEQRLVRERKQLLAMIRQLESRRTRAKDWNGNQLIYWSKVFLPDDVSPA